MFLDILLQNRLYQQIPDDDVISKQRFVLFRIFSFTGALVCIAVFFKMILTIEDPGLLPYLIVSLSIVMLINFYAVHEREKLRSAYFILLASACLLLHCVSYSCGGIQTAGTMYFAVIIMYAFMLLGRKQGQYFTCFVILHVIYLFFISSYTNLTSFAMFKNSTALINEDFLINAILTFFLVASQSSYLQSGKNVIIQRLEKSKLELEEKNNLLEEKNSLLEEYAHSLEKRNKELDKFASVASHDLKAPLRAIGALTGIIEQDALDTFSPATRDNFNTIKARVNRMESLLNALLEYSRADATKGNESEINTAQFFNELRQSYESNKKIRIEISSACPSIYTDPVKLEKIFTLLLKNAILFNDKEVVDVKLLANESETNWQFSVKDNGPGIAQNYHEKIFVIFQTLNRRDDVESLGAGLAIAKKIVEDLGGKIGVRSEAGQGAEFYFTIPKPTMPRRKLSLVA